MDKETFEQRPRHETLQVKKAVLQWEDTPSAKWLRWEGAWYMLGIAQTTSIA